MLMEQRESVSSKLTIETDEDRAFSYQQPVISNKNFQPYLVA